MSRLRPTSEGHGLAGFLSRHVGFEGVLLLTAVVVGLGAGLGAIVFRWLIDAVHHAAFVWLPQALPGAGLSYVVIAPVVGGAIVGPLIYFFAREAKGHGVPEVMEAVALRGGRIRPIVALVKTLASALTIGSGGSVGREGPIVQIGSTLGSMLGQGLRLSDSRVRNLVACGAAAGIAATFNAPIAGVMFALEVILGDFGVRSFGTVVISSVTASIVGRAAFGDVPAFVIPEYAINSAWEYPLYVLLGVLAAVVGAAYVRAIYWSEDGFDRWKRVPEWTKPAIGGLLLGVFCLLYSQLPGLGFETVPQVFGVGYPTIEAGLLGEKTMLVLLALVALKIIATAVTLGSGGSGGVFAPSLFIGSMLGGAFGLAAHQLFPGLPGPPGAYALVGMGAVFAGSTHASITGVLIIFEMTGNYRVILPLMLAVVTASLLGRRLLGGDSIYTLKLTRRGVRLRGGHDVDVLEGVRVEEVMSAADSVHEDVPVAGVTAIFLKANRNALTVLDDAGELVGVISLTDVRAAESQGGVDALLVRDVMSRPVLTAYLDETLQDALRRMGPRDLSRLPVVARDDPGRLLGVLRRNDVVRAYNLSLTRRVQDRLELPGSLRVGGNVEFIEVEIDARSALVGRSVAELASELPEDSLLVSIRRVDGTEIVPHGKTRLAVGDCVIAYARAEDLPALRGALTAAAHAS